MQISLRQIALAAIAASTFATAAEAADPLYKLGSATVLRSTDTDWDYAKLEPHGSRLFIARRKDGLVVFDVNTRREVGTVANSVGANGPLLLPQFHRGYAAMTDGTLLIFDLKTLKAIDRIKLADDGGLNGAVYDPATKRVQVVVGARTETSHYYTLDAASGRLLAKTPFPFKKMDDPAPDGKGHLFAPARYDNVILKLDSSDLTEKARFTVGPCVQPVAVEYQESTNRLLIGCRGDKPVLIAMDAADGKIVGQVPIGKGIDGLAIDEKRGRIVTSNGGDATLSVIGQTGADSYKLLGNVATRPMARIMQIDERTGRLFLVTADHTLPPADAKDAAPMFHPNSFTVLEYKPQ
jgi:DNA-binding beta-propeller fold protein YncE